MGLVYQVMGHSISLNMQNAVAVQNGMQQINAAVIATACRGILALPQSVSNQPSSSTIALLYESKDNSQGSKNPTSQEQKNDGNAKDNDPDGKSESTKQ
jgi:hypothetical protein